MKELTLRIEVDSIFMRLTLSSYSGLIQLQIQKRLHPDKYMLDYGDTESRVAAAPVRSAPTFVLVALEIGLSFGVAILSKPDIGPTCEPDGRIEVPLAISPCSPSNLERIHQHDRRHEQRSCINLRLGQTTDSLRLLHFLPNGRRIIPPTGRECVERIVW
jgi:hypothetical protein